MENATKALLIAAGVLIAVMVISAGIYLFVNYSEVVYQHDKNKAAQAQVQYNNKFEKFVDKELTPQDVITIVNLAKDYNNRISDKEIKVILVGENAIKKFKENDEIMKFINNETEKETKYEIPITDEEKGIKGIIKNSDNVIQEIYIKKKTT